MTLEEAYWLGYQRGTRQMEAEWEPISARLDRIFDQPTHAELELRRWGPGGRKHFGNPRPGDFPGRNRG